MLMVIYLDKTAPGNAAQGEMRLTDCHYIRVVDNPHVCMICMVAIYRQTDTRRK